MGSGSRRRITPKAYQLRLFQGATYKILHQFLAIDLRDDEKVEYHGHFLMMNFRRSVSFEVDCCTDEQVR